MSMTLSAWFIAILFCRSALGGRLHRPVAGVAIDESTETKFRPATFVRDDWGNNRAR
jgi:hypothetical protein